MVGASGPDQEKGKERTIYRAIVILVGLADHLVDFGVGEVFTNRFHDLAQLVGRDGAAAVLVEHVEGGAGLVGEMMGFDGGRHHFDEFCNDQQDVWSVWIRGGNPPPGGRIWT